MLKRIGNKVLFISFRKMPRPRPQCPPGISSAFECVDTKKGNYSGIL